MIKVKSPANIAFVKHWGMSSDGMPMSPSVSMNLSECFTVTEFEESDKTEVIVLNENGDGIELNLKDKRDSKIFEQIEYIKNIANSTKNVRVVSRNNFPAKSGIASSASGFSALTFGLANFYGLKMDLAELTAKMGSISAVRSLGNGFTGIKTDLTLVDFTNQLQKFSMCDLVVILDSAAKVHSSHDGQTASKNSPLFEKRVEEAKLDFEFLFNQDYDFEQFGKITEKQALLLHMTTISASPPIQYFTNKTLQLIHHVWKLREEGLEVYFTIDAGSNVHLICKELDSEVIMDQISKIEFVKKIIKNIPCNGTHILN